MYLILTLALWGLCLKSFKLGLMLFGLICKTYLRKLCISFLCGLQFSLILSGLIGQTDFMHLLILIGPCSFTVSNKRLQSRDF